MNNAHRSQVARSLIVSLGLLALWGCATPTETPPDWISTAGAVTESQLVAYGRGVDHDEALQRARQDAAAQISQILVSDLEAQGIAVTGDVGEAIETQAEVRLETQDPMERFRSRDAQGVVEQYLLYEYLPENKNRDLTEIYAAAGLGGSVASDAPAAESSRDQTKPATPLEEIRALLAGPIPESSTERRQLLEEVRRHAEEVSILVEPRQRSVALGASLSSGFSATVRTADGGEPLRELPLRVQFRGPLVDGRRTTSETQVRTDQDGTAQIPAATPALTGTTRIEVEPVWLAGQMDFWESVLVDPELQDLLASIGEQLRVRAAVQVTSQASSIPTSMIVLDRDIAGNPIGSGDTMRGMAQEFMNTDFRIREVDLSAPARRRLAEAESISVADLYDILPFEVLSRTERVIVGDAHILEFSEEDGFTVVVEVEVAAFDLRRDRVLARVSFRERITGSDANSAIRTAFQAAGRRLVRQLVPRLP